MEEMHKETFPVFSAFAKLTKFPERYRQPPMNGIL